MKSRSATIATVNFLFWNIRKQELGSIISSLAQEHSVDVLILVECAIHPTHLLKELNPIGNVSYTFAAPVIPSETAVYVRYSDEFLTNVYTDNRLSIRTIQFPGKDQLLLCVLHSPSRLYYEENDQTAEAFEVNKTIRDIEKKVGHNRTIVVGDLNMNPFSKGMTNANGFNAVMTREIAATETRVVQSRSHPFFFNPMWSHFGDGTRKCPGTYYYAPSGYESLYWHMLDQVLVRPVLMDALTGEDLQILDRSKSASLLSKYRKPKASDHLPIKFKLRI